MTEAEGGKSPWVAGSLKRHRGTSGQRKTVGPWYRSYPWAYGLPVQPPTGSYDGMMAVSSPEAGLRQSLWLVIVLGFRGTGGLQAQLADFQAKGLPGNPQQAGRVPLAPLRVPQDPT